MARPVPGGPAPAPAVQHLRVRYAKRGKMRFASHRDVARVVERGVRSARLPVAYSAGFNPHPKISYAGGVPTGVASEAEYLELALTSPCDPQDVQGRLDAALPDGMDVIEVTDGAGTAGPSGSGPAGSGPSSGGAVPGGAVPGMGLSFQASFEASEWQAVVVGVSRDDIEWAITEFLAADHVQVERLTGKGIRQFDARAAVISLEVQRRGDDAQPAGCEIIRMVVRHMTPVVRPDDVLTALGAAHRSSADFGGARDAFPGGKTPGRFAPSSPPVVTRLAQGLLDTVDPRCLGLGVRQSAMQGHEAPGDRASAVLSDVPPARRREAIQSVAEGAVLGGHSPSRDSAFPAPRDGHAPEGPLSDGPDPDGLRISARQDPAVLLPDAPEQTTNLGAVAASEAGTAQVIGHDVLSRGATDPSRTRAPGSLTGESPDARNRAVQQRFRR